MGKKEDKFVAKTALRHDWITEEQFEECWHFRSDENPLVDILVARGYLSRSQRDMVLKELDKVKAQKARKSEEMGVCQNCGAEFNIKLLATGRRLKCGKCGAPLYSDNADEENSPWAEDIQETINRPAPPEIFFNSVEETIIRQTPKDLYSPPAGSKTVRREKHKYVIPGYKIIDLLGEDASGPTYKARSLEHDNKMVIVKIFDKKSLEDKEYIQDLSNCFRNSIEFSHENIKKNYAIEFHKDFVYAVSEYIEGDSLQKIMARGTQIPINKAKKIVTHIAKVLRSAHKQGIIHGDICPSNIIIAKGGRVVLNNLGIPRKVTENIQHIIEVSGSSPFYLAPECLAEGTEADFRRDIYSLGACFYHMLARKPSFEGTSPFEILGRFADNTLQLPPLQIYNPTVPSEINAIIERMMQPDPDSRYQDYSHLLMHLQDPSKVLEEKFDSHPEIIPSGGEEMIQVPSPQENFEKLSSFEKMSQTQTRKNTIGLGTMESKVQENNNMEQSSPRRNREDKNLNKKKPFPFAQIIGWGVIITIAWTIYQTNSETKAQLEKAQKTYLSLRSYHREHRNNSDKWQDLENKLADYQTNYKKYEKYTDEVKKLKRDLDTRKDKQLRNIYADFEREVKELIDEGKYGQALEKLDSFPSKFQSKRNVDLIDRRRGDIYAHVESVFKGAMESFEIVTSIYQKFFDTQQEAEKLDQVIKRYGSTKNDLSNVINNFKGENEEGKFSSYVRKSESALKILEEKHQKYQKEATRLAQERSQAIADTAKEEFSEGRENFDFNKARTACQKALRSKDLVEKDRERLKNLELFFREVNEGKSFLERYFKSQKDRPKVVYQGRDVAISKISRENIQVGKTVVSWAEAPKSLLASMIQVALPNAKDKEYLSLSSFAQEIDNLSLAYRILGQKVDSYPPAKKAIDELEILLNEEIESVIEKTNKDIENENWNEALISLILIKNRYLVAPKMQDKYGDEVEQKFNKTLTKTINPDKNKSRFLFANFKSSSQIKDWQIGRSKLEVQSGQLQIQKASIVIPAPNAQACAILFRFQDTGDKFQLEFGPYVLKMNGRGRFGHLVYYPGRLQTKNEDTNIVPGKWFLFQIITREKQIEWYLNEEKYFSADLVSGNSLDKITIKASSSSSIDLDFFAVNSK